MRRRSLRYRITLTLLLFVGISSGLFALAVFYVNDRLESQLLDETLELEFQEFQERYQQDRQLPLPYSTQMRSWLVDPQGPQALPATLWSLSPGMHHDVDIEGRPYHVLNRMMGDKRLYIALDISHIERREHRFALFLVLGVLLASTIAVWVGYLLSHRLIAPVTELAERLSQIEPGRPQAPLAEEFVGMEVEVIACAFDRFLQRLQDFIGREHAFTQDASHELRTPLAVINSAAELLLAEPQLAENLRQPLRRIQRASQQMTRLARALLFLAREPGVPAESEGVGCQADRVLAELADAYRQVHTGRPVDLQIDLAEPVHLPVAPELLEIVTANLLQNALDHTQQGQVRLVLTPQFLMVEDTGRGIDSVDLPRIFERHYRGTGSRGSGRGLDLVSRICDRLDWRITVASVPGQGARFTVWFRNGVPGR
ncbi:MAG TPA: HAMP domain-containing sensor histidine kinase [Nevskiales bacterium]|nr:HAMP domain-containing sensor histidine kinase [Nevskiales bacterium]